MERKPVLTQPTDQHVYSLRKLQIVKQHRSTRECSSFALDNETFCSDPLSLPHKSCTCIFLTQNIVADAAFFCDNVSTENPISVATRNRLTAEILVGKFRRNFTMRLLVRLISQWRRTAWPVYAGLSGLFRISERGGALFPSLLPLPLLPSPPLFPSSPLSFSIPPLPFLSVPSPSHSFPSPAFFPSPLPQLPSLPLEVGPLKSS